MTPLPVFIVRIVIPAHLGLVLRWDSPRTRQTIDRAPFAPVSPVRILN